MWLRMWY